MKNSIAEREAVIWDLDGTIIDSFGIVKDILGEILPEHGFVMPADDVLVKNFHGPLSSSISAALGGIGSEQTQAILENFLEVQNKHYEIVEHHLYADALNLAKWFKAAGLPQVIVTNRDHRDRRLASPRSIVERSQYSQLIDTVIAGDDSQHRKPNPAVMGSWFAELGINPARALVVGDQYVDAEFAMNLGAVAKIVDRAGDGLVHSDRLAPDWPDHVEVVSSLDQVIGANLGF